MNEPGVSSLIPPLVALILALLTRRVLFALGAGVFVGMTLHADLNPIAGLIAVFEQGIFAQLSKGSNSQIVILIAVIGGFVYQLEKSGGMETFARLLVTRVATPARAHVSVLVAGLTIFFTDLGSVLILGPLFRPIFDRLRICREKLAFLVDATAAPVCVLVPVIGWGVYIMGLIDQGYAAVPALAGTSAWDALLSALPYQMYPLLALFSVLIFAWTGRDFGPMRRAQARFKPDQDPSDPQNISPVGARVVILPMVVLLATITVFFATYWIRDGLLRGDAIRSSLVIAYLAAVAAGAWILKQTDRTPWSASLSRFVAGMQRMVPILLILLFAWSLGETCRLLGTAPYLAGLIGDDLPPQLLPVALFVTGSGISLATGSSYGTFAILMPIALPLAHALGAPMPVCIAAVLSGGILGDHASPISDTTVLSSMATQCDHGQHVRTQLPYALTTGLAALIAFAVAGYTSHIGSVVVGMAILPALVLGAIRWEAKAPAM